MTSLNPPPPSSNPAWMPQEEASPELLPFQAEAVAELHELVRAGTLKKRLMRIYVYYFGACIIYNICNIHMCT